MHTVIPGVPAGRLYADALKIFGPFIGHAEHIRIRQYIIKVRRVLLDQPEYTVLFRRFNEVRIIELPPMRVASYRAQSMQPENDAWDKLNQWKNDHHINQGKQARQFGFNNPNPTEDSSIYGYEVWEEVQSNVTGSDGISIKQFDGGIYAVTTATADEPYLDIPRRWQQLYQWVLDSDLKPADHQLLEENLPSVFDGDGKSFQLDLHFPVKK